MLAKLLPSLGKLSDMCHRLIWKRNHQGTMVDHDGAVAHYQKHVEDVKAAVPADRLLVFSVDQGWEPLCKFLGVPVPETPFPRVNDRVEVQRLIRGMIVAGYVTVALAAAVVAVVVYAVIALVT